MKQRLIDASQIENKFLHWLNEISKDITNGIYQGSESDGIAACLEEIREAPTIDPEILRPRAHWDDAKGYDYHVCCSNCGVIFKSWAAFCNYCPNCGARMEDESDET